MLILSFTYSLCCSKYKLLGILFLLSGTDREDFLNSNLVSFTVLVATDACFSKVFLRANEARQFL